VRTAGWVHRYALLLKSGKLEAKVDFDIQSVGDTPIGQVSTSPYRVSSGASIVSLYPGSIMGTKAARQSVVPRIAVSGSSQPRPVPVAKCRPESHKAEVGEERDGAIFQQNRPRPCV
jgi:hypothetical protein